jgi:predicted AAA+ superfamily ATPase
VILITSPKEVGKTQLVKTLAYLYHNHFPQNRVIIFCGIRGLYQDLPYAIHVDLDEVAQEESEKFKSDFSGIPDTSEFKNSLVIFDDTERHSNPKIERMLYQLVDVLAQNGRNFNVFILVVLHQLNKGLQSTTLLREVDAVVIFPKAHSSELHGYSSFHLLSICCHTKLYLHFQSDQQLSCNNTYSD